MFHPPFSLQDKAHFFTMIYTYDFSSFFAVYAFKIRQDAFSLIYMNNIICCVRLYCVASCLSRLHIYYNKDQILITEKKLRTLNCPIVRFWSNFLGAVHTTAHNFSLLINIPIKYSSCFTCLFYFLTIYDTVASASPSLIE